MNISPINNSIQFKGYSNIVSNTSSDNNGTTFSYMAMKLDNVDHPDLDTWKEIQTKLFRMDKPSDYIIFHALGNNENNVFSASDRALNIYEVKSSQDERLMLKAYTLIASLTKRISSKDFHPEDSKLYLTVTELLKNLLNICENQTIASVLATEASLKRVEHFKTADLINSKIQKSMLQYFKL